MAILHSSFCLLHSPGAPDPPREPRGSLRAASGWLPGGFGVASGQPGMLFRRALAVWRLCWRIVGALGSHSGGFEVAFRWLSGRNPLAINTLWGGFAVALAGLRRHPPLFLLSTFCSRLSLRGGFTRPFCLCLLPSAFCLPPSGFARLLPECLRG